MPTDHVFALCVFDARPLFAVHLCSSSRHVSRNVSAESCRVPLVYNRRPRQAEAEVTAEVLSGNVVVADVPPLVAAIDGNEQRFAESEASKPCNDDVIAMRVVRAGYATNDFGTSEAIADACFLTQRNAHQLTDPHEQHPNRSWSPFKSHTGILDRRCPVIGSDTPFRRDS